MSIQTKVLQELTFAGEPCTMAIRVTDGSNVVLMPFDGDRAEADSVAEKISGASFGVLPTLEEALEQP